jgi:hypothetical protein
MQTSLYKSLQKAKDWSLVPGRVPGTGREDTGHVRYIPDKGAILSPLVEMFRTGTNDGYAFLPDGPVTLDGVVSVAMPNRNGGVRDAPVDAEPNMDDYRTQLDNKWRATLNAAAGANGVGETLDRKGKINLVVPDAGCGVFKNDPAEVGWSLGRMLAEFRVEKKQDVFEQIIFAPYNEALYLAAVEGYDEYTPKVSAKPNPAPAPTGAFLPQAPALQSAVGHKSVVSSRSQSPSCFAFIRKLCGLS